MCFVTTKHSTLFETVVSRINLSFRIDRGLCVSAINISPVLDIWSVLPFALLSSTGSAIRIGAVLALVWASTLKFFMLDMIHAYELLYVCFHLDGGLAFLASPLVIDVTASAYDIGTLLCNFDTIELFNHPGFTVSPMASFSLTSSSSFSFSSFSFSVSPSLAMPSS